MASAVANPPKWVTVWAGSAQGPYPIGNASAQPDLRFALPNPALGAHDQTFRLMVRPSLWDREARLRLSNCFGTRPVTFDGVFAGLQQTGSVIVPGSNRHVSFAGHQSVTILPGDSVWSDQVVLPFVHASDDPALRGRRLAISFHVVGESGPITWHAKALTTSFISNPGTGALGGVAGITEFPNTTASWFFLDAVEMNSQDATAIVAFGDSITDGTGSTINGDDRWPDVLLQRLHATGRRDIAVVNAGIGGNQVVGPACYSPQQAIPGGPSALDRLDRDVIALSGVRTVVWLEGINDLGQLGHASAAQVIAGLRQGVARLRAGLAGVRVIGATITSALDCSNDHHGDPQQDEHRRTVNTFIRTGGLFDAVADFDAATLDLATGGIYPQFVPDSTIGGPGDRLHPNRAGYQAMAVAIDLASLFPPAVGSD
jgi:lysophospholipase L1-like esterase